LWGRTGFYQSGGAYGFRDQLQDVMALGACRAGARAVNICCAPRRINSAKAMPSIGGIRPRARGVRTHFSDDFLWLPLWRPAATFRASPIPACSTKKFRFLEGRALKPEEEAYYDLPPARTNRARSTNIACARSSTG